MSQQNVLSKLTELNLEDKSYWTDAQWKEYEYLQAQRKLWHIINPPKTFFQTYKDELIVKYKKESFFL